ncbi:nuclease-related domain-containing protein [Thiothrix lacustris]|uniref:Nuclease-related domain-containing protein n=1 Tax=Thiothrix lacustris TaxID=525917 RepID=A0ABY9MVX7_9GAMM|nr:nuclease-related domain-containing protein [Thiothrix lacustris]WML92071.1 nuclease-related domain-containing protein [Thiothrix lacustris]WMP16111.1 nuclease-related domain-containing protein [Thiothrix lacustris]
MLVKSTDDKTAALTTLGQLKQYPNLTDSQYKAIEKEIRILRAGIKGEEESAYLIDFTFKDSKNYMVIHDLRLELNGRVAQIDHLLFDRTLQVFVFETKHFHAGIEINENGEFLRWNDFKKTYEGMPSPLEQSERHITVLKDAFKAIDMPTRLGLRLMPSCIPYVLVSASARIDRPKKFDTSHVIKADALKSHIMQKDDIFNVLHTLGSAARAVSSETLEDIARKLCALHQPVTINYLAKFGLPEQPVTLASPEAIPKKHTATTANGAQHCRKCNSTNLAIQYGRFGYYFKCIECDGNTPIKVACDKEGCQARIRKEGDLFHRECLMCNRSSLFFTNPKTVSSC